MVFDHFLKPAAVAAGFFVGMTFLILKHPDIRDLANWLNFITSSKPGAMNKPLFYTYMLTNFEKNVIYISFTNNLGIRLVEQWLGTKDDAFTKRYNVHYLVWFEETKYVLNAIAKEKELKALFREKKETIISEFNPEWRFLNEELLGNWPPNTAQIELASERMENARFS